MKNVLFVCLGNICRSPMAEAMARAAADRAGLEATFDSAGTGAWHVGEPPDRRAQAAARARGLDLSPLRARQAKAADFAAFDLILAMDRNNLAALQAIRPPGARAELRLFTSLIGPAAPADVPDPYYEGDFDGVLDLIETGAKGLIAELAA